MVQVQRAVDPYVGAGAVGGVGAAVTWRGRHRGATLDHTAMEKLRRFLSPSSPRVCALGGARFDPERCAPPVAPLWPTHSVAPAVRMYACWRGVLPEG